jgi:hypothetical protein
MGMVWPKLCAFHTKLAGWSVEIRYSLKRKVSLYVPLTGDNYLGDVIGEWGNGYGLATTVYISHQAGRAGCGSTVLSSAE